MGNPCKPSIFPSLAVSVPSAKSPATHDEAFWGFKEQGNMVINLLGTRGQKEMQMKVGNMGTKAVFLLFQGTGNNKIGKDQYFYGTREGGTSEHKTP